MRILLETLKNLVTKPFTRRYPFEKLVPYPRFRGNLVYHSDICIGCRRCEQNCPSNAIKFYRKGRIDFDLGMCMQCGLCVDVCPVHAIDFNRDFERATKKRKDLVVK